VRDRRSTRNDDGIEIVIQHTDLAGAGYLQTRVGRDDAARGTGHDQFVAERRRARLRQVASGFGEHFQRPGNVEDLESLEAYQRDFPRGAAHLRRRKSFRRAGLHERGILLTNRW
jgi:hypothetical protein